MGHRAGVRIARLALGCVISGLLSAFPVAAAEPTPEPLVTMTPNPAVSGQVVTIVGANGVCGGARSAGGAVLTSRPPIVDPEGSFPPAPDRTDPTLTESRLTWLGDDASFVVPDVPAGSYTLYIGGCWERDIPDSPTFAALDIVLAPSTDTAGPLAPAFPWAVVVGVAAFLRALARMSSGRE